MATSTDSLDQYTSPARKLLAFFKRSRDGWKQKHHQVKKQLKKEQNQVRAVEKSREQWKEKAQKAEQDLKELKAELEAQKKSMNP